MLCMGLLHWYQDLRTMKIYSILAVNHEVSIPIAPSSTYRNKGGFEICDLLKSYDEKT